MKKHYQGSALPFSTIHAEDDYLHPPTRLEIPCDHFTQIETNLYGFNIPQHDINCNIYILWHPHFNCMSAHIFVAKGKTTFSHHLEADYFNEHLFLPIVTDNRDFELSLGTCKLGIKIIDPLNHIEIKCLDMAQNFSLTLDCYGALPPVGRPGGQHFTQLMKTKGSLKLEGTSYDINGHYMRDRSWSYQRPESAESAPPYRWLTAWLDDGTSFVIAWLDTDMLKAPEFGPEWDTAPSNKGGDGQNKWESASDTPSVNLRSGWVSKDGKIEPVTEMILDCHYQNDDPLLTTHFDIILKDASGRTFNLYGEVGQMLPKMYWQTMLTYMHAVTFTSKDTAAVGHGDLMDTYSSAHLKFVKSQTLKSTEKGDISC